MDKPTLDPSLLNRPPLTKADKFLVALCIINGIGLIALGVLSFMYIGVHGAFDIILPLYYM